MAKSSQEHLKFVPQLEGFFSGLVQGSSHMKMGESLETDDDVLEKQLQSSFHKFINIVVDGLTKAKSNNFNLDGLDLKATLKEDNFATRILCILAQKRGLKIAVPYYRSEIDLTLVLGNDDIITVAFTSEGKEGKLNINIIDNYYQPQEKDRLQALLNVLNTWKNQGFQEYFNYLDRQDIQEALELVTDPLKAELIYLWEDYKF